MYFTILLFSIFYQINAVLMSIRDVFKTIQKLKTGIPYVHVYVCMGNTDAVTCVNVIETALVIKLSAG